MLGCACKAVDAYLGFETCCGSCRANVSSLVPCVYVRTNTQTYRETYLGGGVASCRYFRREHTSLDVPVYGEVPHSQETKLFGFLAGRVILS